MSIYDFKVKAQDGSEVSLSDYKGKVLLIVNTATGCGFTPQYDELQLVDVLQLIRKTVWRFWIFPVINLQNRRPAVMRRFTLSAPAAMELPSHSFLRLTS